MVLQVWRFVTILLAALALSATSAHVLELPQKMQHGADLYSSVNTTMYRYFAIVGGLYPAFQWAFAGALAHLLAFVSWLVLVAPVNGRIEAALEGAPPGRTAAAGVSSAPSCSGGLRIVSGDLRTLRTSRAGDETGARRQKPGTYASHSSCQSPE
jgi:hypothetical protein